MAEADDDAPTSSPGISSIVIVDDDVASDPGRHPGLSSAPDDDDFPIVIVDEESAPLAAPAQATGALGRLWDSWHLAIDSDITGSLQASSIDDAPWRALASAWLESRLLPAPNLSFSATALGRTGIDTSVDGSGLAAVADRARPTGYADLYELFARVSVDRATVQLGRLVLPWGRTRVAGLGDRLQPPDLRRGPPFPDPVHQRQPQLGASVKGPLGVVGVEGVAFVSYEPSEGSLAAVDQGGVRTARYQTALARAPSRARGLLVGDDRTTLRPNFTLGAPTVAGRATSRIGDIDVNASVVAGFDETPTLHLSRDAARALASEALVAIGASAAAAPDGLPCGGDLSLSCLGVDDVLTYDRTTSFAADASWGLGIVIVRAEIAAWPSALGGRSALLVDGDGVRSARVGQAAGAIAVEGQLGPFVDGSFELFDVAWDAVPAGAWLWGVEPLSTSTTGARSVHRVALGADLGGAFFDERLAWRLRGETGVLQPDVLMSAEVKLRLPVLGLFVGGRGDVFAGVVGSPGWMRQDASQIALFVGEGT